ncbi:glycosyltransferase family 2 protein, partial [Candidatus Omnitrophota bacterium]
MNNINLSIVIPTYCRIESLKRCLGALESQTCNKNRFEIIIVNDA